jgi:hypothetical protein
MKRLLLTTANIVFVYFFLSGQEFDLTYNASESGIQTHTARNSITLEPGYIYSPNGGSLTIEIQNPVVTGTVAYTSTVDPENRTLNSSYLVGATNGNFNVDPTGSATYSVPLELLPGVNGLAPSISLVYSSNSGPGIAGYGWQISGLSVISRGPNTFYYDGLAQGIEMSISDRYYLDGQRLINTSSTYGSADAQYQTENDIFTRITPKEVYQSGPSWFRAETKSGLIYEYGKTTGSKQIISGFSQTVAKWYVSSISDLFGNSMNISYLKDNNCVYPGEILYGPNKITFYYKEKYEKDASFLKGTKIEQWLVLDKIIVKYNSVVVKTYEFKYNYITSNYCGYSALNEIIEYGIGTNRYNSTAITYQIPSNVSFSQTMYNTTHAYITYKSKLCAGDFNGDGKTDFFCLPDPSKGATWTGFRVYYGDGNDNFTNCDVHTTPTFNLNQLNDIRSLDINGDGLDDIVYEYLVSGVSYFYYMLSYGSYILGVPYSISTVSSNGAFTGLSGKNYRSNYLMENDNEFSGADYNGDGINDIFINDPLGNWIIKSFGDGSGGRTTSLNTLGAGNSSSLNSAVVSADFNGDGKSELWSFSNGNLFIYTLNGSTLSLAISSFALPYLVNFGDFNADGKADLFLYGSIVGGTIYDMSSWQVWLSTGAGFEQYYIPSKKSNLKDDYLRLGDFNGDGATDIMVTSKDNSWTGSYYYISKNKGTDFYVHSLPTYPIATHNYYLGDYNCDGQTDFICTDGQAEWWNGYQVYKTIGNTSLLAEKIGNGLGQLTKISYAKLSQASSGIYQPSSGAVYPVLDYQGPFSVVSSVQLDNGLGTLNTVSYSYEGAKMHLQGKGFLCFSKVKKTNATMGIEDHDIYAFNTTYYYPQLIQTFTKRTGVNDTISKNINTWS